MPTTVGLRRVSTRTMRPDRRPSRPGGAAATGRLLVDKDQVALHGAADLVGGDEDVLACPVTGLVTGWGPDEAEAIAGEVKSAAHQAIATGARVFGFRTSFGLRGPDRLRDSPRLLHTQEV